LKGGANAEASRNLAVSGTDRTPPHVNAAAVILLALNGSAHSQTLKKKLSSHTAWRPRCTT